MIRSRYLERLGFSENEMDILAKPSKEILDKIMEAHLKNINFENLSQHGLPFKPTLNVDAIATKILDVKRGGFCFELNGLLAELLLELGFEVKRVPAIVHTPDTGFDHAASHLILVVSVPGRKAYSGWLTLALVSPPSIH
jgi:N-hydroxyarylamine O-acetyltransferase